MVSNIIYVFYVFQLVVIQLLLLILLFLFCSSSVDNFYCFGAISSLILTLLSYDFCMFIILRRNEALISVFIRI